MGMVIGRLGFCRKKINPDIPIAKATGMPVRRNNINAHMTNSILGNSSLGQQKVIYRNPRPPLPVGERERVRGNFKYFG
jgi:hypothetical protein